MRFYCRLLLPSCFMRWVSAGTRHIRTGQRLVYVLYVPGEHVAELMYPGYCKALTFCPPSPSGLRGFETKESKGLKQVIKLPLEQGAHNFVHFNI